MDRNIDLPVVILAILKAGGSYLPLDPAWPEHRLQFVLRDTGTPVVLTQPQHVRRFYEQEPRIICLSVEEELINLQSPENLSELSHSDNLAYIMYTSGSTGVPKGVGVAHKDVSCLVTNQNYVTLGINETFLLFAPITFDASTFEIWGCLLNGGKLVVIPSHNLSLQELGCEIRFNQITTLWLTAGLFHQMVDEQLEDLKGVRQLLAGGDTLSLTHVVKAVGELDGTVLINGYGPTECTTFSCAHRIGKNDFRGASVPIGRPISNTLVYILDEKLQAIPSGVTGELHIGGDGPARGYLNRPGTTAEKFIPNPFSKELGGRLYRTGDRARFSADGTIEFCGREDTQIKLRGHRIELGEIEHALAQHPDVRESAVIASGDAPDRKHLVAYVTTDSQALAVHDLKIYLKDRLPEYMIPAAIVKLEALPLTRNGKLDRRRLPEPEGMGEATAEYVEARGPIEEIVAGIWREVLRRDRIGVEDNFFDLGGHSLLATKVVSRVRKELGVELSLRMFFEGSTIAELARKVAELKRERGEKEEPKIRRIRREARVSD